MCAELVSKAPRFSFPFTKNEKPGKWPWGSKVGRNPNSSECDPDLTEL